MYVLSLSADIQDNRSWGNMAGVYYKFTVQLAGQDKTPAKLTPTEGTPKIKYINIQHLNKLCYTKSRMK